MTLADLYWPSKPKVKNTPQIGVFLTLALGGKAVILLSLFKNDESIFESFFYTDLLFDERLFVNVLEPGNLLRVLLLFALF